MSSKPMQTLIFVLCLLAFLSIGCGGPVERPDPDSAGAVPILDEDGATLTPDQLVSRLAEGGWVASAEEGGEGEVTAIRLNRVGAMPPGGIMGFQPPPGALMIDDSVLIRDEDGNRLTPEQMMERMGAGGWRPEPVHGKDGELVEIVLIRDDSVTPPVAGDGHPLSSGALRDRWIGNPLPDLDLVTLDGTVLGAEEIEDKVVVLNFWFRACKPCLMEIPELNELVEAFGSEEVVFLAVTFDNEEQTREVLAEKPFAYHIVTGGQRIHEQFTIESYPTHLVFDADGRCTAALSGYTPGIGRMLEHEIRAALEATS